MFDKVWLGCTRLITLYLFVYISLDCECARATCALTLYFNVVCFCVQRIESALQWKNPPYIIILDFGESVVNDMNTINQVFNLYKTMELVKIFNKALKTVMPLS